MALFACDFDLASREDKRQQLTEKVFYCFLNSDIPYRLEEGWLYNGCPVWGVTCDRSIMDHAAEHHFLFVHEGNEWHIYADAFTRSYYEHHVEGKDAEWAFSKPSKEPVDDFRTATRLYSFKDEGNLIAPPSSVTITEDEEVFFRTFTDMSLFDHVNDLIEKTADERKGKVFKKVSRRSSDLGSDDDADDEYRSHRISGDNPFLTIEPDNSASVLLYTGILGSTIKGPSAALPGDLLLPPCLSYYSTIHTASTTVTNHVSF